MLHEGENERKSLARGSYCPLPLFFPSFLLSFCLFCSVIISYVVNTGCSLLYKIFSILHKVQCICSIKCIDLVLNAGQYSTSVLHDIFLYHHVTMQHPSTHKGSVLASMVYHGTFLLVKSFFIVEKCSSH